MASGMFARFAEDVAAREFAASVGAPGQRVPWTGESQGDGAYAYETGDGVGYQPLAELLIGSGIRISEALALRFGHVDLEHDAIRVIGQRDREGDETRATKGKRFRSVLGAPQLPSDGEPSLQASSRPPPVRTGRRSGPGSPRWTQRRGNAVPTARAEHAPP